MFTAVGRDRKTSTKKLWIEIIVLGVVGAFLLVAGLIWLIGTGFEYKITAVPIAFGGVGVGFAIFGLIALQGVKKGWEEGQQVVSVNQQNINLGGLQFPWANTVYVSSFGEYKDHLSVGFGAAAYGKGQQAKVHMPVRKLMKVKLKHRLASTYLIFALENVPDNFGEGWELGTIVRPDPKQPNKVLVVVSPDLFLDREANGNLLNTIKHIALQNRTLYTHYTFGNAFALVLAVWYSYVARGMQTTGNYITDGTISFYNWFSQLNDDNIIDLGKRLEAATEAPGYAEARDKEFQALVTNIGAALGREEFPDQLYTSALTMTIADRILSRDPKAVDATNSAAKAIEMLVAPFVAYGNGIPVSANAQQLILGPFAQVGFVYPNNNLPQQPQQVVTQPQVAPQPRSNGVPQLPNRPTLPARPTLAPRP